MNSAIDQVVTQAARQFVENLGKINDEPYIREAVMKLAVREVCWAMLETFGDQYELAEHLETMAGLIHDHKEERSHAG